MGGEGLDGEAEGFPLGGSGGEVGDGDADVVNAIFTDDVEFYHDKAGFSQGEQVRENTRNLTESCPSKQGVTRSLVPGSLREAAFALGAPRWKVATMVTLRAAKSGVITGLLLAVARIAGETAPLLFTALNNQFFSTDMGAPMANLPVVIFQFAMSPYDNWIDLAWGGALLITLAVLALNILARVFFREKVRA